MKPETSATLKVIAVGFFLLFIIFIGLSVPFYVKQRNILKNWNIANAKVASADLVTRQAKRGTLYDARFILVYNIGSTTFTTTVNTGYNGTSRVRAERWINRFPEGREVKIAYNPVLPTQVRLDPGYNSYFFAVPLLITNIGLIFAVIAGATFFIARRAESKMRAAQHSTPTVG